MLETNLLKSTSPLFISLEGGEGTGKSTQTPLLVQALQKAGLNVVQTREPGGCDQALQLRKLLVEGDGDRWDGLSEALLMSAARNEHLRHTIRPALAEGQWVVTDRFADSTTVYQGAGRGLPEKTLGALHNMVVQQTWPDLTLVLDIPSTDGLERAESRTENTNETRFESLGESFHDKIRAGFLAIAKANPQRCRVVDARGSIDDVHQRILATLNTFLQDRIA